MLQLVYLRVYVGCHPRIAVANGDGDDPTEEVQIFFPIDVPNVLHAGMVGNKGITVVGRDRREEKLFVLPENFFFGHGARVPWRCEPIFSEIPNPRPSSRGEGSLLTSRLLPFKSIATIAIPHPGLKPGIRDLRKARPAPPSCPPLQFLRPRLCYPAQIAARISAAEALSPKVSLTCTNRSTLPGAKTKLPPS